MYSIGSMRPEELQGNLEKRFLLIHKENNWKKQWKKTAIKKLKYNKNWMNEEILTAIETEIKERIIVKQWVEWNMKLIYNKLMLLNWIELKLSVSKEMKI